jgi:hypothetical protein
VVSMIWLMMVDDLAADEVTDGVDDLATDE